MLLWGCCGVVVVARALLCGCYGVVSVVDHHHSDVIKHLTLSRSCSSSDVWLNKHLHSSELSELILITLNHTLLTSSSHDLIQKSQNSQRPIENLPMFISNQMMKCDENRPLHFPLNAFGRGCARPRVANFEDHDKCLEGTFSILHNHRLFYILWIWMEDVSLHKMSLKLIH